ncbi:bifunctional 3-(3-hydroxy-phenyl)propionate/3-hydroxycinnamic acid hydroxylase [Shinella sumterensis]|uniref:Bifunctional 3-(3-hydroxy-phenyl)propionate/3-hydroxycinnamic acid hydroxylase n=1 Tax=Shinella sumterensis TaxID=1967501 RepID=A0AA50H733_9HYPH|nr:bifunctional 3-(3-hydroxy-phenyl)propionate/3-hydroxycinnamic acid hydroxylase [Shinella sumterensis]WLS00665.1 bifunctional 3-(3-hydroxy-phenyl)propionate/3-hydroxycinnamic acid hydroxylase [Shinella sumterensis]
MTVRESILDVDVAIVGAGPTGLTLANLLGGMGVSVALLERNITTVQEPRAVSIDDESMRTMQAAGLDVAVEKIVARGYGSRYLSPRRKLFLTVDPTSRDYGFDKRNAFQQPDLEALLRDGLGRHDSVIQRFGWEMQSFAQDDEAVSVEIAHGTEGAATVRARYMVACDGGRSPTRGKLGIQLVGSTFAERWLIVDLVKTENRFRHTEVNCDSARPCISLPGPDNIRRYEFMLHPGEDEKVATDEAFVRDLLAHVGPDRDCEFRRVRVYTFHARLAESWRVGRIFLAGDAAHLTPPFAGQGMNSGLRDAHNLAWKLAEAVRGADRAGLLDSYEAERRPHAWEMIELALRMGRIMMPENAAKALLTRIVFRALGLYPPARDYFAQMRYKPKPRFRQGLLWPDGFSEKATMVGRLIPQPVVEDTNRNRILLDRVLPDSPVVLVFDEFPDRVLSAEAVRALEATGAFVVGLTPEWMNPIDGAFPVYRDAGRLFSGPQMRAYLGRAFLLRRDRYVAATVPTDQSGELVALIAGLSASMAITPGKEVFADAS